ncbi:helix-turn-helix domain-containing protein [Paracoccus sp. PAR01]|uniref:helix-turn-helix domain-containing protein n=1 Tax=Paracoccus sp. PAR01 TaxID=2769282 RepID=UPI00177C27FD|nr:helix-turn-helix transcriptional regulator [Paracoccus sp. PAR01]MBD9529003.1 helix-turn-helix transcriptional regulator [Paracoccus sp. PAR01]
MVIDANLVTAQICAMSNAQHALLSEQTLSEMRPERIGARLKLLREALGYTPSEISDELGIERTYWSRFENARRPVNDTTAALLVERYGVTLDFLVLGKWDKLPLDLAGKMRAVLSAKNN